VDRGVSVCVCGCVQIRRRGVWVRVCVCVWMCTDGACVSLLPSSFLNSFLLISSHPPFFPLPGCAVSRDWDCTSAVHICLILPSFFVLFVPLFRYRVLLHNQYYYLLLLFFLNILSNVHGLVIFLLLLFSLSGCPIPCSGSGSCSYPQMDLYRPTPTRTAPTTSAVVCASPRPTPRMALPPPLLHPRYWRCLRHHHLLLLFFFFPFLPTRPFTPIRTRPLTFAHPRLSTLPLPPSPCFCPSRPRRAHRYCACSGVLLPPRLHSIVTSSVPPSSSVVIRQEGGERR
jgi:hypothetical protein